jgi:hypothetical protein
MEFHTCGHLKQDGVFCNSPALRGRSSRYFDFNLRGRRLNHANPEPNSLRLNILPASLTGSIFCADFRLSPPVFSIFYEQGGGGGGGLYPFVSTSRFPSHRVPVVDHPAGNRERGEFRAETHSFQPCEYVGTRLYSCYGRGCRRKEWSSG